MTASASRCDKNLDVVCIFNILYHSLDKYCDEDMGPIGWQLDEHFDVGDRGY
jgi:hypothetical protein